MAYLNATDIARYWSAISEAERQELVKDVRGSIEYGSSVTFQRLPDAAKFKVQAAYACAQRLLESREKHAVCSNPHHGFGEHPHFADCEDWQG